MIPVSEIPFRYLHDELVRRGDMNPIPSEDLFRSLGVLNKIRRVKTTTFIAGDSNDTKSRVKRDGLVKDMPTEVVTIEDGDKTHVSVSVDVVPQTIIYTCQATKVEWLESFVSDLPTEDIMLEMKYRTPEYSYPWNMRAEDMVDLLRSRGEIIRLSTSFTMERFKSLREAVADVVEMMIDPYHYTVRAGNPKRGVDVSWGIDVVHQTYKSDGRGNLKATLFRLQEVPSSPDFGVDWGKDGDYTRFVELCNNEIIRALMIPPHILRPSQGQTYGTADRQELCIAST